MKLFKDIAKELAAYEQRRESVIRSSRDILRDAKRIIFLCHEGKLDEASPALERITATIREKEKKFQKPITTSSKNFSLYNEGPWSSAVEEYLEAWFLYHFLVKHQLQTPAGIKPPANVHIGALADFTGEVLRGAVLRGADKDVRALERYRRTIADVVAFMLPLYLTGQSRMKFDQAKRNLKRIEEIIYEVKIRT